MRLLKLLKLLAPVGLAVVVLGTNPDNSNGQFPGGERGGRDRGRGGPPSGGEQPGGVIQFQMPQGGGPGGDRGGRGGSSGDRGGRGGFGGFSGGAAPGGFGGGAAPGGFGGGAFNASSMADGSFARLQASYGGSGDSLDYSKIPAATREQTNAMAQRFGGEPMPASGSISKEQYRDQFAKRMETMRGGGGRGGFSMTMSAPGTTPAATPGAVSFDTPGTTPGSAPQWGQQPQWGGGRSGSQGGGFDPSQVTDEQIQERLRRYDRDNDGRISAAEAQGSDRLRGVFQQYDKNADGFMDLAEYKVYYMDAISGQGQGSPGQSWGQNGQPGGWGGGTGGWGGSEGGVPRGPVEEPKPVVLRYGKLPKELPSWFNTLDTNQDGQIALYEWRNEGRLATDFVPMDLNSDGLVTAEEYLRYKNPNLSTSSSVPGAPGESPRAGGNPFGGGRGGNPFGGGTAGSSGTAGNPFGGRGTPTRGDSGSTGREDKREKKEDRGNEKGRGAPPSGGNPFSGRR